MSKAHTTNTQEEKKTHPFLFLVFLSFLGISAIVSWNLWENKTKQQRLANITRSEDIDILLEGGLFTEKETIAALSNQLNKSLNTLFPKNFFGKKSSPEKANTETSNSEKTSAAQEPFIFTEVMPIKETSSMNENDVDTTDAFIDNIPNYSQDTVNLALRDVFISQGAHGAENWRLKAEWATLRQETSVLNLKNPSLLYQTGDRNNQGNKTTQSANNFRVDSANPSKNENSAKIKPFKITELNRNKDKDEGEDERKVNFDKNISDPQKHFFNNSRDMLLVTAKNGLIFDNNTKIRLTQDVLAKQKDSYVQGDTLNYDDSTKIASFPNFATFASKNIQGHALALNWDLSKNKLIGSGNIEMIWFQNKKETP